LGTAGDADFKVIHSRFYHQIAQFWCETRNFLQALLDNLPVAIFVKDGHPENFGAFQFWNQTSEQLFGISAEQAIGKTDYDFFPIEQAKYFYEKDQEIFVKGSVEDILEELVE
jgi:diguanylate cyclase/phosphodiesterase with PAS/PAC and GAF sensor(s)